MNKVTTFECPDCHRKFNLVPQINPVEEPSVEEKERARMWRNPHYRRPNYTPLRGIW